MAFEIISLESKPVYFTHIFGQKLAILGETLTWRMSCIFLPWLCQWKNILLNGLKRLPRSKSVISIQHSTSSILPPSPSPPLRCCTALVGGNKEENIFFIWWINYEDLGWFSSFSQLGCVYPDPGHLRYSSASLGSCNFYLLGKMRRPTANTGLATQIVCPVLGFSRGWSLRSFFWIHFTYI